ncbi:MAG: lipopolysaccharide transport system permease protein [Frankiales bacterium]|nr:lipopolysaccharide transport system permease protein [Frankiales bacterium]
MATVGAANQPVLELTAAPASPIALIRSIVAHRGLIATLARKDFFVKYRRATLGVLWAVGLPLIQATTLTVIFTYVFHLNLSEDTPRAVFMFTGITAYNFFSTSIVSASTSIVDGSGLSSRIYFPRAVLPLQSVIANAYALAFSLVVLLVMTASFGVGFGWHTLLLVPAAILDIAFTASMALVLAALHVFFRDVRYIVQAVLLALFYMTPIFYPLSFAPPNLRIIIMCNPMTGIVELFRFSIGGEDPQWVTASLISLGWTGALLLLAVYLHSKWDRIFVDLL